MHNSSRNRFNSYLSHCFYPCQCNSDLFPQMWTKLRLLSTITFDSWTCFFYVLFKGGQAQVSVENSFGQCQMSFWHTQAIPCLSVSLSSCLVGWRYLIDLFCFCPVVLKPYPTSECLMTLCPYLWAVLGTCTPCGFFFDGTGTIWTCHK